MSKTRWLDHGPSLVVGTGIVLSTLVADFTADYGWWVLSGPILLVLAFLSADLMQSQRKGAARGISPATLILGPVFVLAALIVALRDPTLVTSFIPIMGAAAWVAVFLRPGGPSRGCGWMKSHSTGA
ncbi:MAG TPA: hypothetical protein VF210_08860 [Pseudomonadales bacterium]